ncbi:MAG: DUF5011 domain-containing protein [Gemmiger sp.]|uniref:immunoglobulin-like domain-containing protein n=1 Tax=Gemmiger sp. TaxID=2049027 RepID=UPI002E75EF5C|nr:immunoglobulin-like domain-containing protein [Gemmiger sp.]MEE0800713.1 DUF5011 domain-containing protein [Gemmiger sp.]
MNNKHRTLAGLLSVCMALSLAACGSGENTEPEITGVQDQSVEAGSEFDAMAGVTATDAEDGDVTGKVSITSLPELTFQNGKATPTEPGDYELTYTVTDKGGLESKAYATLKVTRQAGEATELMSFDFSAPSQADAHGWAAQIADGVQATGELKQGAYVFTITDPGSSDTDIALVKSGVAVEPATYRVKVWAKATAPTYAHLLARDEAAADGSFLGGEYNLPIGTEMAPLEMEFTAPAAGTAELRLNLGRITPNPDNPSDTTPANVTVTIDKIELYKITGEQTKTPVYTADFAAADAVSVTAGDGASATASASGGTGTIQIDAYPSSDGGVWSIKGDLALPGVTLTAGEQYYYSLTVQAADAQSAECLVESAEQADKARANFNSISLEAGKQATITNVFTAESDVTDPVIRLQLGTAADGVTSNTLTVSGLEFGTVEGDLQTDKTIDYFGESIAASASPDLLWTVYNGTDEDNERGVGTIWTENGSLFYRIDQGGTVDWHNKLIFGHRDNPLTLPADSYFTVQITAKASKPVSCGFYLNPLGGWDPRISEGLDLTTEEQTFTFETTDPLITDMDFEMLFQFGSADTAALGEVTIEISDITILQRSVA